MPVSMINVSDAVSIVANHVKRLGTETVAIAGCVGRILAEDIVADIDLPPFDRSQMDGYAVRAADTANAPLKLKLVGESAAGRGWHHTLSAGEAVAIMTGAPLPDGSDAVQKIELTTRPDGETVEMIEPTATGRYIVKAGSETRRGDTLIKSGQTIMPNMISVLASFGYAGVKVGRSPRVAILGTGSEIVEIADTPGRDQIRNSNSAMLDVLARRCASVTTVLPNAIDDIAALRSQIADAAAAADVLIMTGGVSVGKYDLTKTAISDLGAEVYFEKVRLKPGKPAVFARLNDTWIFALPGNPVSAAVTFHLFVRPALLALQGAAELAPKSGFAVLSADARAAKERDTYLPARLSTDSKGRLIAEPMRWHGSSDLVGFSGAEVLVVLDRGTISKKGDVVRIEYL